MFGKLLIGAAIAALAVVPTVASAHGHRGHGGSYYGQGRAYNGGYNRGYRSASRYYRGYSRPRIVVTYGSGYGYGNSGYYNNGYYNNGSYDGRGYDRNYDNRQSGYDDGYRRSGRGRDCRDDDDY
jgi:hypothetical protein